jgi:hypothetical protein
MRKSGSFLPLFQPDGSDEAWSERTAIPVITANESFRTETDMNNIMKTRFLALLFAVFSSIRLLAQGTLNYVLLPDSTITPHNGATATGPSQSLTGFFSWVPHVPSYVVDSDTFDITALIFKSSAYSLTLTDGSQPDNVTQTGPDGDTSLNAYVNWPGGAQNPYFIGGFGQGTYLGPAAAPSQLILTEGLGSNTGGNWIGYLYIDAQLVPEPSAWSLSALASGGMLSLKLRRKLLTRAASTSGRGVDSDSPRHSLSQQ